MKSKDEIIEALGKLDNGAEFVSGLNSILKESNENSKKLENLNAKITELEESNKAATDNYNKLADFIGLSIDTSDVDAALETIKKNKGAASDAEKVTLQSKINELARALKAEQDKNNEISARANGERTKRQSMIRDLNIRNALESNKALNPAITSKLLRDRVKVNDDDSLTFMADDGSEVTVDEGVKSFLEKYPEYRANSQIPGAGGSFGGTKIENVDFEKMSPEEYRKLRKEGKLH